MIDLHSHILPGIDDGAADLQTSLAMARIAVRDGITHCVCTPHVLPQMHGNAAARIAQRVARLRDALAVAGIPLELSVGAEIHLAADVPAGLQNGTLPLLGRGRAMLLELPSVVLPSNILPFTGHLLRLGYRPVLAHPERLRWVETRFDLLPALHGQGVAMQVTAGSILGRFGSRARFWSERLLDSGLVDVIATDAHDAVLRPPLLKAACEAAARWVGDDAALAMVTTTPASLVGAPAVAIPEGEIPPDHLSPAFILALRDRFAAIGGLQ